MPANQSTPEVTRTDEARRLIEKLAGADIDVSGTAAIGITSADIIAANDWLSATPARGGNELREAAQGVLSKRWASSSGEWGIPEWVETDEPRRFAEQILASTDMAGASVPDRLARRMGAEFVARDDVPPVEGLTSGEGLREQLREAQAERDFLHDLVTKIGVHCESEDEMVPLRIENESDASVGVDGRWALYLPDGYKVEIVSTASPKATATASVRDHIAGDGKLVEHLRSYAGTCTGLEPRRILTAAADRLATLTDSGTAATIGGERAC